MAKQFIYLSTCDTCRKIMKEVELPADYELHDLKKAALPNEVLELLLTEYSPLELVNKRSRKIKELGLVLGEMSNQDIIGYLKSEYTFIKRPIAIDGNNFFVGNSKAVRLALKSHISES